MDAVRAVTRVVVHGGITGIAVIRAVRDELMDNVLAWRLEAGTRPSAANEIPPWPRIRDQDPPRQQEIS